MTSNHRKSLSLTKICFRVALATTATFLRQSLRKYENICSAVFLFLLLPFVLVWEIRQFLVSEITAEKLYITMLVSEEILTAFLVYSAYARRELIKKTQRMAFHGSYVDSTYIRICDELTKEHLIKFALILYLMCTFISYPIIFALFFEAQLGSSLTLLCPSAYPWPMNTLGWYLFSLMIQFATVVPLIFSFVGNYAVVLIFRITTVVHHRRLLHKIGELDQRKGKKCSTEDEEMLRKASDIFQYHQFLKTYVIFNQKSIGSRD